MYDGIRRRALPVLFKALEPGADDDRMKGALWTINYPAFGKYALSGSLPSDFLANTQVNFFNLQSRASL